MDHGAIKYHRQLVLVIAISNCLSTFHLTHWGRVTHICINKLTIIGSDNGLWLGRSQAIIWTDAGVSLIGSLWTNFNEILIEIHPFTLKKVYFENVVWKMASILSRLQCIKVNIWPKAQCPSRHWKNLFYHPPSHHCAIHHNAWHGAGFWYQNSDLTNDTEQFSLRVYSRKPLIRCMTIQSLPVSLALWFASRIRMVYLLPTT